ncbi:M3 family metallopeptidase [Bryobacter aggregatus]|uniref:M3 family metallopeptidase n=1 Tax=Bryobacter aggregatus TaxID=360054 RepID=UPI0004E0E711|nr:M3 family metallopeptidase [Bryobacter aggregatus]
MNPLLRVPFEIPFDQIEVAHIVPAVRQLLGEAQANIDAIANSTEPRSFANTMAALDEAGVNLENAMAVVRHLECVSNTPELREAIQTIDPEVSAFYSAIPLNDKLWKAIQGVPETGLDAVQKRFLTKQVDAFRRHGAELEAPAKARLTEIDVALQGLCTKFSQNVLDATNAYELIVEEEAKLAGLPENAKQAARASAEAKAKSGWRFTLQAPSYLPVLTYLDDAEIRRQMWQAYMSRATSGEYDNRDLMRQILTLRREKAHLLGYFTFADFVLADRMAQRGVIAQEFVGGLELATRDKFGEEHSALEAFAGKTLEPWDISYYAEKQREKLYAFDEEALRPYFAVGPVVDGMFRLCERLFGIEVQHRPDAKVYEPSVNYYEIFSDGRMIGAFYADWFPRESKRGGAWMEPVRTGGPQPDGSFAPHLGVICGNMTPPMADKPALLTHREVETIFHEFGHLLHHCLSEVPIRSLSGTNVPWDFVELPSQIMENWCWERESLDFFARHYESGETIPEELFQKMVRARQYRAASAQMRQLGFATVDLTLHTEFDPKVEVDLLDFANAVLQRFAVTQLPKDYGMILGFTHLFSGPVGYAAGYYSYKWAEVLDADAFSRFKAEGVLNAATGREYRAKILAKGNSEEARDLFRGFMGRDPDQAALLQRNGLA